MTLTHVISKVKVSLKFRYIKFAASAVIFVRHFVRTNEHYKWLLVL